MKNTIVLLCFLSLFSVLTPLHSTEKLSFQRFSVAEGLSQSTVFDMKQDSYGQLWIATDNGLNRYNGRTFTSFFNRREDNTSILANSLYSILFDSHQRMWIGTKMGICQYDSDLEKFINYPFVVGNTQVNIMDILEIGEDEYLLGTNIGLYSFSPQRGYVKRASPDMGRVNVLMKCEHRILLGTDEGLFSYFPETDSYELTEQEMHHTPVVCLASHLDERGKVWVGTEGSGLYLLDLTYKTYKKYRHDAKRPQSLSSNYVRSLCYDNQNRLWVGTFVGLNIMNAEADMFERYYSDFFEKDAISQNSIKKMLLDSQGGMWCGTFYGGLSYYHPGRNRFLNFKSIKEQNSLSDNVVSVMAVDRLNNIWIGTNENGLNYYDQASGHFTHYKHQADHPASIPANNVKAILLESDEKIWVGTHGGGLSLFHPKTKQFTRIHVSDSKPTDEAVYALAKDQINQLWVGTLYGLFIYNESLKTVTPVLRDKAGTPLANPQVMALFVDSKQRIWIGTDNGINKYNQDTQLFEVACSPEQNNKSIWCFFEDSKKNIWVGTTTGLLKYDEITNLFVDMTTEIGFPQVGICGVQEDASGRLWIGSGNGLIAFDVKNGKWIVYTEADGIQNDQFSMYSYCTDTNGRMFFGGVKGVTSFIPAQMTLNQYAPIPLFDRFSLSYHPVLPFDKTGILTSSIRTTKSITLSRDQSIFSIDFSVPNYVSGYNNNFAYQLVGFDQDWIYTKEGVARYSNLRPGKYMFKVKASNSDGVWSDGSADLEIVVLPHWWETWWATLLYIILFVVVSVLGVRIYAARKLMQGELDMERKEKLQNEELSESKIRFFINISHEFRTPLTLILSPLYEMLSKGVSDKWQRAQLELIQRNAKRMMRLIDQVLDYRRSELGAMKLHIARKNVVDDVQGIFNLFTQVAHKKHINYLFHNHLLHPEVFYDPHFMERILSNLISNAFKYTPEGGTIEVILGQEDNHLIVEVQDTGCGIPEDKHQSIFDRFYQVDDLMPGSGIGLSMVKNLVTTHQGTIQVKSRLGEGSRFIVTVPCTSECYDSSVLEPESSCVKENAAYTITERELSYMNEYAPVIETEEEVTSERMESVDRKKILLVEDDDEVRGYLKDNFSQQYQVVTAVNGKEALECLEDSPEVALIVSDVMMPVMNGIQLCKHLKHNVYYSHIPIILLTAKSDVSAQLDGLQAGADDYISKPFVYAILHTKISNLIKAREALLQRYSNSKEPDVAELATNVMDQEFLQKAVSVVEKYMENPEFSTEDFSREMGMSRSNLYLKLKALTNESAVLFIRRIRFSCACKLLQEGRYNVSEISAIIGLTPSYFATSFKKYMGCMPSEYVKKQQSE